MEWSDIYQRVPECLCEKLDEEAIVYNPLTAQAFELNTSSLIIWELLDGQLSVADIIALLEETHSGANHLISDDVASVIQQFLTIRAAVKVS